MSQQEEIARDVITMLYARNFKDSGHAGANLSVSEIAEYRKTRPAVRKSSPKQQPSCTVPEASERLAQQRAYIDSILKDDSEAGKRFYQYKAIGNPKRRKYWRWLSENSRKGPVSDSDIDSWISAAIFTKTYNPYTGSDMLRKDKRCAVSVDCNFVILKWEKSELDFIPAPEQGKDLVLSICRENGLPEPRITYTADGLEVKWYWQEKIERDCRDIKNFNSEWDVIQDKLYCMFWYLGAVKKGVSAMFRVPGSMNTTKRLRTKDRLVRDIHEGQTVSSYREIQRVLNVNQQKQEMRELNARNKMLMGKWEMISMRNSGLAAEWANDVFRIHTPNENWVCIGTMNGGHWKSYYVQACNLPLYLMKFSESFEFRDCDIYISQGEFLSRCSRKADNLAAIRVCFVDLDYKLMKEYRPEWINNPSAEEWKGLVTEHCSRYDIPYPNDTVFTGGGVHLKWILSEEVCKPDIEYWQYAQKLLQAQFRTLGADPASTDAARVLRLAGTENHKNTPMIKDRKVRVISMFDLFQSVNITLNTLIGELESSHSDNADEFNAAVAAWKNRGSKITKAAKSQKSKKKKAKPECISSASALTHKQTRRKENQTKSIAGNFSSTARKRFQDIITLLNLRSGRDGKISQSCRELCVFWGMVSAYQAGLIESWEDYSAKAEMLIDMCGSQFRSECSISTVSSGYRKNYKAKTSTLIKVLQITEKEQEHMQVLKKKAKPRQDRAEWLSEHGQERSKPWFALGISRAAYFRMKKEEAANPSLHAPSQQ